MRRLPVIVWLIRALANPAIENSQGSRFMRFPDVVDIPQTGLPNHCAVCPVSEPFLRRRVDAQSRRRTKQRDDAAFDDPTLAGCGRFVTHPHPEQRHATDVLGNCSLKGVLDCAHLRWG